MTFDHMADNITNERHSFLKYPRFVQMIINSQAPELSKEGLEEIYQAHMTEATLGKMLVYRKDTGGVLHKPVYKDLICALKDPNYKCPPSTKWRNEGSDSEQEDLGVAPISESDDEGERDEVVPTGARESHVVGGTSGSAQRKMKGKRKKKDDDDILDLEDFLKENRKRTFKKVQGTVSGSGPTSTIPVNPTQSQPIPSQQPQQNPSAGSLRNVVTTTAGGATVDVSEMQVDLRLMKENYLDMMKRQKKFEEETTNYLKILQSKLKEEASYRIAVANENIKLKQEVEELKVENEGMKGYAKLLMEKVKKVEKNNKQLLRLTTGEGGEISDSEESEEPAAEGEEADDEATQSESEG